MKALAGWPFVEKKILINGQHMAYVDEGSGPPVLLVHGNPTWGFYFRALLKSLPAAGLRAIAPDHVGMGRSDKPSAKDYPHTLSRRVSDLATFIKALTFEQPISIVAHDWGGAIALAWGVDHVEEIDKLVLFNTGAFPLPADKSMPWSLTAARSPVIGEFAVRGLNAFSRGALVMGSGQRWLPAEARRGLAAPYDSPAQMFWGMKDPVFDAVVLDHLVELMPQAVVHRYPDAGHYVLEDAADRIVPLVTEFLRQ